MGRFMLAVVMVFLSVGVCLGEVVYIEDNGVIIPVEVKKNIVKMITHSNGGTTEIYDYPNRTDIIHPDGTTTSIFDGDYGN